MRYRLLAVINYGLMAVQEAYSKHFVSSEMVAGKLRIKDTNGAIWKVRLELVQGGEDRYNDLGRFIKPTQEQVTKEEDNDSEDPE